MALGEPEEANMKILVLITILATLAAPLAADDATATTPDTEATTEKGISVSQQPELNYRDVALLPYVTASLDADLSQATWDTTRDLLVSKGYRVVPLEKTLKVMRDQEVFPTMFIQVQKESADERIKQTVQVVAGSEDWRGAALRLCSALGVSRMIVAQIDATNIKKKTNRLVSMVTFGGLGTTKRLEVQVQAAAYGAKTGSQIWWASDKDAKKANQILFFAPKAADMLGEGVVRSITRVFEGFFDQDVLAYGAINLVPAPDNVRAEKDGLKGIKLQWNKVSDPRVIGYVIYRSTGSEGFNPNPVGRIAETSFLDEAKNLSLRTTFRYKITSYTETDGESPPSQEVSCKF